MLIVSIKEFCIQYDSLLNMLRVEWVGGRNMRHFQDAFSQLVKLASELLVTRVVLDINTLPDVSVYDQLWLSKHFMPSLLQLSLQQAVVVLRNERVYNHHVVESLLADGILVDKIDVQLFTQVEAALQWITDNSPQLPQLLAEWTLAAGAGGDDTDIAEPRLRYRRR